MMVLTAGTITPKGDCLGSRAADLAFDIWDVLYSEARHSREMPTKPGKVGHGPYKLGIVVETPFATKRPPGNAQRSVVSLPVYGVAVGVALTQAARMAGENPEMAKILTPASDEWCRGWAPAVRGDRYKSGRVVFADRLCGTSLLEQSGSKSKAADIADALLLALWGRDRLPGSEIIVGIDPSMSCTGYAILTGDCG